MVDVHCTFIWNQASALQIRISHAVIMSTPPPTQAECIAAMTGLEHLSIAEKLSWNCWMIPLTLWAFLAVSPSMLKNIPAKTAKSAPWKQENIGMYYIVW